MDLNETKVCHGVAREAGANAAMVVMARLDRIDASVQSLVVEVRAMHSRHERLAHRVERLKERAPSDG